MFILYVLVMLGVMLGMQKSKIGAQQSVFMTVLTALAWPIILGAVIYHKFEEMPCDNKGDK